MSGLAVTLSIAILGLLTGRAIWVMRSEANAPRGIEPGRGDTEIDCSYFSGAGGGGDQRIVRVPRDPQDYARAFVPRRNRRPQKGDDR
jgi:hypothetical protein